MKKKDDTYKQLEKQLEKERKDRLKLEAELKAVNEKVKETDAGSAEKLRQVRSRLESDLEREVCCMCAL